MIDAKQASNNAQICNREKWINATLNAISEKVEESSKAGLRRCTITAPIYVGSESLYEASESLTILANELKQKGFEHFIDENGVLVIEW
jgi:hypothetical protein